MRISNYNPGGVSYAWFTKDGTYLPGAKVYEVRLRKEDARYRKGPLENNLYYLILSGGNLYLQPYSDWMGATEITDDEEKFTYLHAIARQQEWR